MKILKGFTLVESLVVVSVLAVLMVLSAPNYSAYVQSSKVNTTVDMLNQQLNFAKYSAVNFHTDVVLSIVDNSFCLTADAAANPSANLVIGNCNIRNDSYPKNITINPTTSITFDAVYGRPSVAATFAISSGIKSRTVAVNTIGLIKTTPMVSV